MFLKRKKSKRVLHARRHPKRQIKQGDRVEDRHIHTEMKRDQRGDLEPRTGETLFIQTTVAVAQVVH